MKSLPASGTVWSVIISLQAAAHASSAAAFRGQGPVPRQPVPEPIEQRLRHRDEQISRFRRGRQPDPGSSYRSEVIAATTR
jgi:hypothetical protein